MFEAIKLFWLGFIISAFSIGIGGLIAHFGTKEFERKRIIKGVSLLIIGTLLIGLGGIGTTYGWDLYSELRARKILIHSIDIELRYNQELLNESVVFNQSDSLFDSRYQSYPMLRNLISYNAALNELLWNDKRLIDLLANYTNYIDKLNVAFDKFNKAHESLSVSYKQIKDDRETFLKSPALSRLLEMQTDIKNHIDSTYLP